MSTSKINTIAASIGTVPYTTTISISKHQIISDEPESNGGADKGPKPHDLVLSGLIACTCITVKMYAMRKEWPLEEVIVDAVMKRTVDSGIQTTTVVQYLSFKGNLEQGQRDRLIEIAARCPVHKTLSAAMTITTKLK